MLDIIDVTLGYLIVLAVLILFALHLCREIQRARTALRDAIRNHPFKGH